MGIKNLNRFFIDNCSEHAIHTRPLSFFKGKTIAIDASIYMYKYRVDNRLIENMYLLISILLKYEILPIFVFDGKPPPEKLELIQQRNILKKEAKLKYNQFQNELESNKDTLLSKDKKTIIEEMDKLKKQFIRINETDIIQVKQLITASGIPFIDALGEADQLCVSLVKTGKAWACLSDDMDMFVYGCDRVMRYISLMQHTVLLYDLKLILTELNLSMKLFKEILVLSGTDYNTRDDTSLKETINWLYKYNKNESFKDSPTNSILPADTCTFYKWLTDNTRYIKDIQKLMTVYNIFELKNYPYLEQYNIVTFTKQLPDIEKLHELLKLHGFVYPS